MSELELQSLPEAQYLHYIDLGWNKKCGVLLLDVKSVFYLAINTYVCEFRSILCVGCVQCWVCPGLVDGALLQEVRYSTRSA